MSEDAKRWQIQAGPRIFNGQGRAIGPETLGATVVPEAALTAMQEKRDEAVARAERAEGALAWYADPNNYDENGAPGEWVTIGPDLDRMHSETEWEVDEPGYRASIVLAASTQPKGGTTDG